KAIRSGLAGSTVLDAKLPMILERDFKPGGKISINLKDIKNAMAAAQDTNTPLPLTGQLREILQALADSGHMDDDHGGIVQYFESLAGVEVKSK
ncbi:MAG: NAD-binding protein, partial [Oscillospiraceae bacterium]|nr:NAD-binding protein [Oscillospiraceae bacterium]